MIQNLKVSILFFKEYKLLKINSNVKNIKYFFTLFDIYSLTSSLILIYNL